LSFLCYYLFKTYTNRNVKWAIGSFIVVLMSAFFYRAIYNAAADSAPFKFLFFEREIRVKKVEHESS
jgi:hypothetical protein